MGSFFILGFLLGMRHAIEADHIVAITNLNNQSKSFKESINKGMFWGIGHTITLFVFGIAAIIFQVKISEKMSHYLEMGVGIMLVVLGLNVLYQFKKNKIHFHQHQHNNANPHLHVHSHSQAQTTHLKHKHKHHQKIPIRALSIGLIHGMAGSTALILLVLQTVQSPLLGLFYIITFGVGSILGMALLSVAITMPFKAISEKNSFIQIIFQVIIFLSTVVFKCRRAECV